MAQPLFPAMGLLGWNTDGLGGEEPEGPAPLTIRYLKTEDSWKPPINLTYLLVGDLVAIPSINYNTL